MVAETSKVSMEKTSEDLTDVMWSDPQWLASFPLNDATAFHYFTMSQFYDPRCNNELVKMQQLDPKLLKTMEGIEYSHSSPCPGLFIITKSFRTLKPPKLEPLAYYYIHEGRIYQAPTLHAILSARLLQSFHHLRKTFDTIRKAAALSSQGKYVWEPSPVPPDELQVPEGYELSTGEHKAVDELLFDIWQKNNAINEQQIEKQQQRQQQQQEQSKQAQPQSQNLQQPQNSQQRHQTQ